MQASVSAAGGPPSSPDSYDRFLASDSSDSYDSDADSDVSSVLPVGPVRSDPLPPSHRRASYSPHPPSAARAALMMQLHLRNVRVQDSLYALRSAALPALVESLDDPITYLNGFIEATMPATVPRPVPAEFLVYLPVPALGGCERFHDGVLLDLHARRVIEEQCRRNNPPPSPDHFPGLSGDSSSMSSPVGSLSSDSSASAVP